MEDKNSGNKQEEVEEPTNPPFLRASTFSSSSTDIGNFGFNSVSDNPFFTGTNGTMDANDKGAGKSFFLRPSPLQHHVNLIKEPTVPAPSQSNPFKLDPPKLLCPLTEKKGFPLETSPLKEEAGKEEGGREACSSKQAEASSASDSVEVTSNGISKEESSKDAGDQGCSENGTSSASTTAASTSAAAAGASGFVFGSNLADRVINGKSEEADEDDSSMPTFETATTSLATPFENSAPSLSLQESAAKQQSKDLKPELKEVKMQTGEEGESNVLQIFAKLHAFDKVNQAWLERGRGWVRLNDMPAENNSTFQSRLVMRAQGSLRVILNMKLWPGMLVDRVSSKNLKVSAIDPSNGLMVYLLTATMHDIEQMHEAVHSRSEQMHEASQKRTHCDVPPTSPVNKKPRLEGNGDESNDSSAPYPETETSNEGFTSSPAVQSSPSSEA